MATYVKTLMPGLLTLALLASSPVASAATLPPVAPDRDSTLIKVQGHHKRSGKNWSAPQPQHHQRRRKHNNDALIVGAGIAAVLGAIALSQQAQADDSLRRECRSLRYKCREGRGWACRRFEDDCM